MPDALAPAVRALGRGGLVVYATDTLYGLAADAKNGAAVVRLVRTKRRPPGMPISVLVSSTEEIDALAALSEPARRFVRTRLPGPFTVVVRARPDAPIVPALWNADGTLGVRVPDHPVARELARRAGPITATSANRHGEPAGRTIPEIRRALGRAVDEYLSLGPSPSGHPSQLVDLTGPQPRSIARRRPGARR
jgi:L-threonylcarbamoyladenylate synthase